MKPRDVLQDAIDLVKKPLTEQVSLLSLFLVSGIVLFLIVPFWAWILWHMRMAGEAVGGAASDIIEGATGG